MTHWQNVETSQSATLPDDNQTSTHQKKRGMFLMNVAPFKGEVNWISTSRGQRYKDVLSISIDTTKRCFFSTKM